MFTKGEIYLGCVYPNIYNYQSTNIYIARQRPARSRMKHVNTIVCEISYYFFMSFWCAT